MGLGFLEGFNLLTYFSLTPQTVTEKHKLNVPETMTEVLDVSDEEGEPACYERFFGRFRICFIASIVNDLIRGAKNKQANENSKIRQLCMILNYFSYNVYIPPFDWYRQVTS